MLPKIVVVADIRFDATNWLTFALEKINYAREMQVSMPEEILAQCRNVPYAQALARCVTWLEQRGAREEIQAIREPMQMAFDAKREEIFSTMHQLTGRWARARTYTCYLTTYNRFPYEYRRRKYLWIGSKYKHHGYICTFLHELNHMQTHVYFEQAMRKYCDATAFQHIKEALSVLNNEVYTKEFMGNVDVGYLEDRELREQILSLWKLGMPFGEICQHMAKAHPTFVEK
jgi:hypothetical protein